MLKFMSRMPGRCHVRCPSGIACSSTFEFRSVNGRKKQHGKKKDNPLNGVTNNLRSPGLVGCDSWDDPPSTVFVEYIIYIIYIYIDVRRYKGEVFDAQLVAFGLADILGPGC